MIQRSLSSYIQRRLSSKKPFQLSGPARSGKSAMIKEVTADSPGFESFDLADPKILKLFTSQDYSRISHLLHAGAINLFMNIQRLPDFENKLGELRALFPDNQFITTCSFSKYIVTDYKSGFTAEQTNFIIHPISWQEYSEYENLVGSKTELEARLIFGMYPEVILNQGKEESILQQLYEDYLFREIFACTPIRKPGVIKKIVQILALYAGREISLNQISDLSKVDKNTVNSYINILEKAFIIFKLQALKRNHQHEVKSSRKIFFYDNGIRNAAISNFNPLNLRQDSEALWENFCISERQKFLYNRQKQYSSYFWRTTGNKAVDYIEEYEDGLHAYTFRWNRSSGKFFSKTFRNSYPGASMDIINATNFSKFIGSAKIKL